MREIPMSDQALLSLESQILQLESTVEGVADDRVIESIGEEIGVLEKNIAAALAQTPAGVAVKVRRLWATLAHDASNSTAENFRTTIKSLELQQSSWAGARVSRSRRTGG